MIYLFDYETLKLIWWVFVGVLLIGFAILGGFDLGVGALLPFAGRTDDERRVMINAHARKHRRKLREFLAPKDDSGLAREIADTGDRIAQADDRGVLLKALAQLPVRQREAVVLRYWEDLTETQTAEAMGCSVGAVKSNAAKGIAKLRAIPGLADMVTSGGGRK